MFPHFTASWTARCDAFIIETRPRGAELYRNRSDPIVQVISLYSSYPSNLALTRLYTVQRRGTDAGKDKMYYQLMLDLSANSRGIVQTYETNYTSTYSWEKCMCMVYGRPAQICMEIPKRHVLPPANFYLHRHVRDVWDIYISVFAYAILCNCCFLFSF